MPVAQLWAVLFFFMLLCLGLDSEVLNRERQGGKSYLHSVPKYEILVLLFLFYLSLQWLK